MQTPRRRIDRLRRLARLHECEQRQAALHAADAQNTHGQLQALGKRSGTIAAAYGARLDARSGGDLIRLLGFTHGLARIQAETESERVLASQASDEAAMKLRLAERRQELSAEKLAAEKRLARSEQQQRDGAHLTSTNPILARKLKG